jgi:hypothetical protein
MWIGYVKLRQLRSMPQQKTSFMLKGPALPLEFWSFHCAHLLC